MWLHLSAPFSLTYTYLKALKTNSTCNKAWKFFKFNVGLRAKDNLPHKYKFASDVYLCRWFACRSRIGLQFCLQELPGTHPLLLNTFIHTAPKTFQSGGYMTSLMETTVGRFNLHIVSKDGRMREPVINKRNKRQGKESSEKGSTWMKKRRKRNWSRPQSPWECLSVSSGKRVQLFTPFRSFSGNH